MTTTEEQWCSWCYKETTHKRVERNYLSRNEYSCNSCSNYTVQCRYCQNMATLKPSISNSDGLLDSLMENWASELCAEHDGTISDFNKLSIRLKSLEDYQALFTNTKWNLAKGGKIAGGMLAGVAVFCPLAYLAAPGLASALGAAGLLGAAGTGTTISTLSGAALTSASLAALGPGGMVGGIVFVSAAGAALGAHQGGVVSNSYFGAINDFKIIKLQDGTGPALVFINGFLSQKNQDASDWLKAVQLKYPSNSKYYVTWESSSLYELGKLIGKGAIDTAFKIYMSELMKRGSRSFAKKLNPLNWVSTIAEIVGNPWHTSIVKSAMTGILLADLLARTDEDEGFILMGHSLGARVIYYLLTALSTKEVSPIKDVFLLGGAVDRKDFHGWKDVIKSVDGSIYNIYSDHDDILKYLYQGMNALQSSPIGLGRIELDHLKIKNIDATEIVNSHMVHKECFETVLSIHT